MKKITVTTAGKLVKVLVIEGQAIKKGDPVAGLVSKEGEISITSEVDGIVNAIAVSNGDFINAGEVVMFVR
ncbi:hypothetical protein GCM10011391_20010 [Pullulanibacillus camelliae]|uniref:Lipoyl-binding domain-containing protein n=1 Tax=Pullulanibacillus camelliae TaxID=1707096 RepID=A0A8J2VZE7_9BACL|nr:biotin/lipoyl-containing protein [Pullulanibacillus camelliae]GGE41261.1 hypothetical protein GCM10011391_20010 [Pullulanibacillus camelliae]